MNEKEKIKIIRELFDVEQDEFHPDEVQLDFMDQRDEIEEKLSYSFEAYVDNYDLIKEYGLDLKLLRKLEWFIVVYLENDGKAFKESEFYRKFKDHEVVQRDFSEYERGKELKND